MTARTRISIGVFGALMASVAGVQADAEERSAEQLVSICASCHRLDGHDQGIPSIVGMPANELVSAMWVFRSDEHANTVMHAMSLALSDKEIETVARRLAIMSPRTER